MAKKLREEDLLLNIIVNGDRGKKEIGEIERAIKDTTSELRSLEKQEKQLRQSNKQNTEAYKAVTTAIKQKNDVLVLAESRLKHLKSAMDVAKMSTTELRSEMNRVRRIRDIAAPLSEEWRKHDARLKEVTLRYQQLNTQAHLTGNSIKRLASNFNHYVGVITAGFATAFAAVTGVRRTITDFAEFDDKVADVMKTTNLTKDSVVGLNQEFRAIDTRTAQNDLLGLARVAGKLGIEGEENILGFVRASDKIGVALSQDLGGDVEGAITAVGKLVDIFRINEEFPLEEALLRVGSTINELGMASTANEGFIVEFTKRMAGVAPLAKVTITDLMGMAATLDSLGQTSEVSTTALSKLFLAMAKNVDVYAKYANMPVDAFKELIDSDANEAFLRVLEGVKNNSDGLTDLAATLGDLGQDGGRVIGVLGSLANNTEKLREQQILANAAFQDGTSITDEFNIKNETAQAKLEKARKGLKNMSVELGEKLMPVMAHSISSFNMLIRLLTILVDFLIKNGKEISVLLALYVSYNAILWAVNLSIKESIVLTKLKIFWENAMLAGTQLLAAAQMLLAGNIKGAAQAMRVFNAVAKLNPFVLLASVVIAAGVALFQYSKSATAAEKAQARLNDLMADSEKSIARERVEMSILLDIARDKERSDEQRKRAIESLNRLSPEYLGNLTLEKINTEEATKATEKYIESLVKKAAVQAAEEELVEIQKKRIDAIRKNGEEELSTWQQTKLWTMRVVGFMHEKENEMIEGYRKNNRENLEADLNAQEELIKDFIKNNSSGLGGAGGTASGVLDDPKETITTIQSLKDELKQLQEERDKIDVNNTSKLLENEKKQVALQQRIAALDIKSHQSKNARTEKQSDKEEKDRERELQKQKEYREKVLEGELSLIEQERLAYQKRLADAGLAGKERIDMTKEELQTLEALQRNHYANLNKLDANALKEELSRKQAFFDDELRELRIKHNEEFKAIKDMEQAKLALQDELSPQALNGLRNMRQAQQELDKKFRREEEALVREHLLNLQNELAGAIESGAFSGIDLSDEILSEEEKQILVDRLAEVREKLSELGLGSGSEVAEERGLRRSNIDILGFTPNDWEIFFDNLNAGRLGVEDLVFASQALAGIWAQYNQFVAAGEARKMQEFERNSREQQDILRRQLDANVITQDSYSQQIDRINADLDRKKAVYERNQAKRERNVALMSAIVSTAAAVAKSLPNLILAKIVGVVGGLQVGAILKTPLPEIPGAESGGFLEDVVRSQDGKPFRAKRNPGKRGYISDPSIIVAEDGSEFVANAKAVKNPTVKPVLDAIDTAQRNGSIDTLNLFRIIDQNRQLTAVMPGRQSGGSLSSMPSSSQGGAGGMNMSMTVEMMEMIRKNNELMSQLMIRLRKPLRADVSLIGRGSLEESQDELDQIQKSANI